jgi:cytochrome c oxidase cbb3-type subunit 3
MQWHRLLIVLVAVPTFATGCESRAQPESGASKPTTSNMFFIGPQPGPDRVLPEPTNPYAGNTAVMAEGRRLFGWYNCSGCHGDHGGGGMGPSLRDSVWRYGGTDPAIFASITQGRQFGMPSWGTKVPSDQIWQIVTYIKSMRTPNEPDAPR